MSSEPDSHLAARHAKERLEVATTEFMPRWPLAPRVEALQALRGVRRLLEPIGYVPPADAEAGYYAAQENLALSA